MLNGTPEFVATQQQQLSDMAPRQGVSAILAERRARRLNRVGELLAMIFGALRIGRSHPTASERVHKAIPQTGEGRSPT